MLGPNLRMRKKNRVPPGDGISLFNSRTGTFEPITVLGLWSTRGENYYNMWDIIQRYTTVLPAKNDSDFMFCLQSYKGLILDRSLV